MILSVLAVAAALTSLGELAKARHAEGIEGRRFEFVGNFIYRNLATGNWRFWDGTNSISVVCGRREHMPGDYDRVRIGLHCGRLGGNLRYVLDSLEVIDTNSPPRALRYTASDVLAAKPRSVYAKVSGTVVRTYPDDIDPRYTRLVVRDSTGTFTSVLDNNRCSPDFIASLVDAEVELEGVPSESVGWRNDFPNWFSLTASAPIRVLTPAPMELEKIPRGINRRCLHRQRLEGTVVARSARRFYIRTALHPSMQVRPVAGARIPEAGERVTVAGFVERDPVKSMLTAALVFPAPAAPRETIEQPLDLDPEELNTVTNGGTVVNTWLSGRLVRIGGVIERIERAEGGEHRILVSVPAANRELAVDVSALDAHAVGVFEKGGRIAVSGLLIAEWENDSREYDSPVFRRFVMLPRTAEDLVLLARPPWWTPERIWLVVTLLVIVVVAFVFWNRHLNRTISMRMRELYDERLSRARAELKVGERTRLAVELHDSISQMLTGVALQVDSAMTASGDKIGPAAGYLGVARQLLASCRRELRDCLWDLRSRTFEEKSLTEAVNRTIAPYADKADIHVQFRVARELLSESIVHAVLRIVRELVVNAIRHGGAKRIRIAGEFRDGVVRLAVTDNGCGFDPAAVCGPREGHFGLQGIRERAHEFGGGVEVFTRPGHGTRVKVSLRTDMKEGL